MALPCVARFLARSAARRLPLLPFACLAACGGRTTLDGPGGASAPPGSGALSAKACGAWSATHAPIQLSRIPSIVEPMSALPTPSGVVVGYADVQLPPVDRDWHARLVSFDDGALGPEQAVLHRGSSTLDWTPISLARGSGQAAATASDDAQGMLFVPIDDRGAPSGPSRVVGGDPARTMFATRSGFSVLRSPFDPSGVLRGPVSVASLDGNGQINHERQLLDGSTPLVAYTRVAYGDDSFLLSWLTDGPCPTGCRTTQAEHFSEKGDPLAAAVTVHTFDAETYGVLEIAASGAASSGFLAVWSEGSSGPVTLVAEPFDADGRPAGSPSTFTTLPGLNAPYFALAGAPGGDYVVAWIDTDSVHSGGIYVQAVSTDGTAEGPVTMLGSVSAMSEEALLVVASAAGAMIVYEDDVPGLGVEVFAIPLRCAP
jgi:hypothetical protein